MKRLSILATVLLFATFILSATTYAVSPKSQSGNTEQTYLDERFLDTYDNRDFDIHFQYPSDWTLEEREFPQDGPSYRAKHQIILTQSQRGSIGISVFSEVPDIKEWIRSSHKNAIADGLMGFEKSRGTISGREAFYWSAPASAHDVAGTVLVFQGESYLYQIGFPTLETEPGTVEILIKTLSIGSGGPTDLQIYKNEITGFTTKSTSCTNCGENDSSNNPYNCCPVLGNCTWKAEQMRSGADNFAFGNVSGRDAYKWMSLAALGSGFAQGGTIPKVGAVMVFIDDFGGSGHVATVKGIMANGTVSVTEQRCNETCTKDIDYDKSILVKYLAGYIYPGSSAPAPLAKTIQATGETVIEDYASTSSYYFGTYGPGCAMSYNGGERMWGTSADGLGGFMHFICSKTGTSENYGWWRALIRTTGLYEVQAWIPSSTTFATATSLKYEVDGSLSSPINQSTNRGRWVRISNPNHVNGYWSFSGGVRYSIYLRDTNNGSAGQFIAFDDLKFIRR